MKLKSFLIMTTFMTLTITTEIFSNEDDTIYYSYEGIKFDNSIDIQEVEQLPAEVLKTMQNSDGIIKSLTTQDMDYEEHMTKNKTMSTNDFSMYVWAEDLIENNSDEDADKWRFNAQGTWNINPFYEFTDVIVLSWSDDFTLDSHKCTIDGSDSRTLTTAIAPERGVAYDVDLQLGSQDKVILLTADVYKFVDNPDTNNANILGEYGHVKIKPSVVSIEFNSNNEIDMSTSFGSKLEKAVPSRTSFTY